MDINVRAFRVVQAALAEPAEPDKRKESARKGGKIGGKMRANALSSQQRTDIAKRASAARWKKRKAQDS